MDIEKNKETKALFHLKFSKIDNLLPDHEQRRKSQSAQYQK